MGKARLQAPARSKYNARRTEVNGIRFDSAAEARRYGELMLLFRAGQIHNLEIQHKFPLHVGSVKIGSYIADFVYFEGEKRIVEDTKGYRTPLYRWKKRHVEAEYKVQIRET